VGERTAVIVAAEAANAPGRAGGVVGGKKTTEGRKLDGQHVYFLFQPTLDFGAKIQTEIILQSLWLCAFPFLYLACL